MRLVRFIKTVVLLTILALAYINMQMTIFDLAYDGKTKEKQIRQLIEENGNLTYRILVLKSADNLGVQLLAEDSDMDFVGSESIVQLDTPEAYLATGLAKQDHVQEERGNGLLNVLSEKFLAKSRFRK